MGIQIQMQHQINKVSLTHGSVRRTLARDSNSRCLCRSFQRTSKHAHGAGPPTADDVSTSVHGPGSRQHHKGQRRLSPSLPAAQGACSQGDSQGDKGHAMPQGEGRQHRGQPFQGAAHHMAGHCHSLEMPLMETGHDGTHEGAWCPHRLFMPPGH